MGGGVPGVEVLLIPNKPGKMTPYVENLGKPGRGFLLGKELLKNLGQFFEFQLKFVSCAFSFRDRRF